MMSMLMLLALPRMADICGLDSCINCHGHESARHGCYDGRVDVSTVRPVLRVVYVKVTFTVWDRFSIDLGLTVP